MLFDILNAIIAIAALGLAGLATYRQRKVSRLSMAVLSFGMVVDENERATIGIKVAFANTGTLTVSVSTMWLASSGATSTRYSHWNADFRCRSRRDSIFIPAGGLAEATAYFEPPVDENTDRDENRHIDVELLVEMVNGKGKFVATTVKGLKLIESDLGNLAGTQCQPGMSATLLPKPKHDQSLPIGA